VVKQALEQAVEGDADEERPLGSYLGLTGVFASAYGALLLAAERSNRLPARVGVISP
jgi:hypothetical protein